MDAYLIDFLPHKAKQIFTTLTVAQEQAYDAAGAASEKLFKEKEDLVAAKRRRSALKIDEADASELALIERVNMLERSLDTATKIAGPLNALIYNLSQFIERTARNGNSLVDIDLPPLPKSDLSELRKMIAVIKDEIVKLEEAPRTKAEVKASILKQLDNLVSGGAPSFSAMRGDEVYTSSELLNLLQMPVASIGVTTVLDRHSACLLAWLMEDVLRQKIDRLFIGPERPDAISDEVYVDKSAALHSQLLNLERQEESLVRSIERDSSVVVRRADANPNAVLSIKVI